MKQPIHIFISAYFIVIALLYLTMRYSTFNMNPVLYTLITSVLILIVLLLCFKRQLAVNLFTVSIIILSLLMILSLYI